MSRLRLKEMEMEMEMEMESVYCPMCGLNETAFNVREQARTIREGGWTEELRVGGMCPDCGEMLRGISASTTRPACTLPAPPSHEWRGPWYWSALAPEGEAVVGPVGLERRYAAGLASLLDRPDIGLRVRAVIPRTGKGSGFVVVCQVGDDLRALARGAGPQETVCGVCTGADVPAPTPLPAPGAGPEVACCGACDGWTVHVQRPLPVEHLGRVAEAELTFVLRRASSGSGRLMLDRSCRRDPEGGPPFPRPYGRLTVVGSTRTPDGACVIGGGPVATRWWLAHEDAEHLIQRRLLPELAWAALAWWETIGAPLPEGRPTWDGADPPRNDPAEDDDQVVVGYPADDIYAYVQ